MYDVKKYKFLHPGGDKVIQENLGKNIEEEFEEQEHSKSARKFMKTLPVYGVMKGSVAEKELRE